MTTTDPGQKSTREIEREIEEDRDRIRQTGRTLQDRLSVGALVDEVLSRGRAHGGEYAGNLGRTIRDNPIPVMLIGISLAWMMAGGQRATERNRHLRHQGDGRVLGPDEEGEYPRPIDRSALSPRPTARAAPPGDALGEHTPGRGLATHERAPAKAGPGTSGPGEDPLTLREGARMPPSRESGPTGEATRPATPPPASRPLGESPGAPAEGAPRPEPAAKPHWERRDEETP